jgi:bifunctional NMN adenylyltransferase/nudix hydrolase
MASHEIEYGVFIGRFQPFHLAHEKMVRTILQQCSKIIIIIGSQSSPRTAKNPFTFNERVELISLALKDLIQEGRVLITGVDDYFYSDAIWATAVQNEAEILSNYSSSIALAAPYKDASSYYLNILPWDKINLIAEPEMFSATNVRKAFYENGEYENLVSPPVFCWLEQFKRNNSVSWRKKGDFKLLLDEYNSVKKYKQPYSSLPYPPIFATCDSVVIKSGHILLVKRGGPIGYGLWALPGGFLKDTETLKRCAVREAKEETKLRLTEESIKDSHVFDHPGRSQLGRVITNAFFWDLGFGELPEVRGCDDAQAARWVPFGKIKQNEMHDDHYSIIMHFLSRK